MENNADLARITAPASPSEKAHQSLLIDWDYYLARRRSLLLEDTTLPPYLLKPEITDLLDATKNDIHHFLINTLWHTGGRISEVLSLTPAHFYFDGKHPEIILPTLKQKRGRPKAGAIKQRLLPVYDSDYIEEALRYLATHRRGKHEPLFDISRATADRWLKAAADTLKAQGEPLSIEVSCHVLRHSFAVNCVLHCVDVPVLQQWLGHKDRRSTEIYTKVLNAETAHMMTRVTFT